MRRIPSCALFPMALVFACGSSQKGGASPPGTPDEAAAGASGGDPTGCGEAKDCTSCLGLFPGNSARCGWCAASQTCIDAQDYGPETPAACSGGWNNSLLKSDLRCSTRGTALTELPVDCRIPNSSDLRCSDPRDSTSITDSLGEGPSLSSVGQFYHGFIEHKKPELIVGISSTDGPAAVLGIDLTSGNRRVVTGSYADLRKGTISVGKGPSTDSYYDVQLAPDGSYYALVQPPTDLGTSEDILRIDPATGDRTLLVDGSTVLCKAGQTGLHFSTYSLTLGANNQEHSIAVGADGTIFGTAFTSDGGGISAIVAIQKGTCRVISSSSFSHDQPEAEIGSGPPLSMEPVSLELAGDTLYGIVSFVAVIAIDITTGARRLVSSADPALHTGMGSGIAADWLWPSKGGKTIYTFGAQAKNTSTSDSNLGAISVDLATGNRTEFPALGGPLAAGGEGAGFEHPAHPGIFVVTQHRGVELFEPATGNSMHLSY
jgi:hypothetical protein